MKFITCSHLKLLIITSLLPFLIPPSKAEGKSRTAYRTPKFWPVGVVRFRNDNCKSIEGYTGVCYNRWECNNMGGFVSGTCANGTCAGSSSYNNTYFINPGYPSTLSDSTSCSFTIKKCNPDVCQVRLDFLNLNLDQPDGNGKCVVDSFTITGSASNVPIICGENSGQHVYLNFNGNNDIIITLSIGASSYARSWNIKITQLGCDCPSLAPTGCLMYFTDLTGVVNSFNYGTTLSGALVINPNNMTRPGTRQMANENYGVCVQMKAGYCSIQWSQGLDPTSFTVSGDTALTDASTMGLPGNPTIGTMCTTDFVVIPNPSFVNGTAVGADRFCGNQFPTVTSTSKPFILTVVTNDNDIMDVANRGFSLNYRQLPCGSITTGMMLSP